MEVVMPSSTPTRIAEYYYSAPTTPRFYNNGGDDFAFDVTHDSQTPSLSAAEDLFDGGVIKPFKPPPPPPRNATEAAAPPHRGRDRGAAIPRRRAVRSLSPVREPQYLKALAVPPCKGPKKWRLKDFFLFRSASEGRSAGKDPLMKYTAACSSGSRRGPVSAHELHYTVNRAVSEDLKKKTFLPYKQGILGRLAFNPAVHALSNGFGFSRKFK